MESVLFGQAQLGVKYGTSRTRLAIACRIYQEVCTLLLQSLESLQMCLQHLSGLIPDLQRPSVRLVDCRKRMKKLIEVAQSLETEEDFLLKANSDISQLCAENILLWNKFLDAFTLREVIRRHLAQVNHCHRVRRFAEGFFTMNNPRKSALCCLDAKHQHYMLVSEAVRRSDYFSNLPDLTVSCRDLDGASDSLPIIFEDIYSEGVPRLPKRNSAVAPDPGLRLLEGASCVLVSSSSGLTPAASSTAAGGLVSASSPGPGSRPASVPGDADLTATRGDRDSSSGPKVDESLDRFKRDLSLFVEAASESKEVGNHKKVAKKKISLPIKLSDDRLASTLPSESKSKQERKRSMDSSVNILSPTLSPDMKLYLKEKLKSNLRLDAKHKNKIKEKAVTDSKFHKGHSGYSHLECCSNIPYNLEEEPELVDGMKNPKFKNDHEISFTSRVLTDEANDHNGDHSEHHHTYILDTLTEKNEAFPTENLSRNPPVSQSRELEGMDKVREIVLKNSMKKAREEDSVSDSSLSEASGWVSNSSRRSSLSTTDTNSENVTKERTKSLSSDSKSKYNQSCKKKPDIDLKSPGLILSKSSRSKSEEPSEAALSSPLSPAVSGRPRHRSESGSSHHR